MMYLGKDAVGLATSTPLFADIAKIEAGIYTPEEDEVVSTKTFTHSLGEIPDFLVFFDINFPLSEQQSEMYITKGHIIKYINSNSNKIGCHISINYTRVNNSTANLSGIDILDQYFTNNTTFYLPGPPGSMLKAGETYNYVIGKFKEVTPNA